MSTLDKFKALTRQLYPTGRAFKMPFQSFFEKLNNGLSTSEVRAFDDCRSILDSALPDNDNFTADDATAWERRLGLIVDPPIPLSDRMLAIRRKMGYTDVVGRQSLEFIQKELRSAGFDVHLRERLFNRAYVTDTTNLRANSFRLTTAGSHQAVEDMGAAVLTDPRGIFVYKRKAYVVDNADNRVRVFDIFNGGVHIPAEDFGASRLISPVGIFIKDGLAYVTDQDGTGVTAKVYIFNISNGAFVGDFGTGIMYTPESVFVTDIRIYVVDSIWPIVYVFDKTTLGHLNSEDLVTGLVAPTDISIVRDKAYVCDQVAGKILVYNILTGARLASEDIGSGSLNSPVGLSIANERVFVVDAGTDSVKVFNFSTGALIASEEFGSGTLNNPKYIFCDDSIYTDLAIVNSIDLVIDSTFDPGINTGSSFYITGTGIYDFATADADRMIEFRQLVLRLKPVQTVAWNRVNFV